jgi:predicted methyltransferase
VSSVRRVAVVVLALCGAALAHPHAQSEQLRDTWQRTAELFAAAGVRPGASVADVGAGDGYLTVRLSQAVGAGGKIYAIDIDAKALDGLRERLAKAGLTNVEVVHGADDDPHLAAGSIDGAIILNAYHEMPHGVTVLTHLAAALRPAGRLVLCEPAPRAPGQSRAAQVDDHTIDPEFVVEDVRAAGFSVVDRRDRFATNLGGSNFGFVAAQRP